MQNNPKFPSRAAAVPVATPSFKVNIYKNKIYVYQESPASVFCFPSSKKPVLVGKRVGVYQQNADNLKMVQQLFPNASLYGA